MRTEALETWKRPRAIWPGTAWFLCVALGAAVVHRLLGPGGAVAVAAVYGLGTIGMAWITVRPSGYPLWSWLGTSIVMAAALVVSAKLFPDARSAGQWTDMAWLFPWFFLFTGLTPARTAGWCSPRAPFAGAILFGMGVVFALILLGVAWLPGR